MALILCLETATEVCSVALFRDELLLGIKESATRNVHSSMVTVFIETIMKEAGTRLDELDAIAVSMGPGSYTGLRIGVATAKGLCYALEKPLISVPTLQSMAYGIQCEMERKHSEQGQATGTPEKNPFLVCPMIDARRMEVYCAVYDDQCMEVAEVRAEVMDADSFGTLLAHHRIMFGGEGAEKCKPLLEHHPNAVFMDGFNPSARHMGALALLKFSRKQFEDLAYFEPFYLKDFIAGKPRVKGLH